MNDTFVNCTLCAQATCDPNGYLYAIIGLAITQISSLAFIIIEELRKKYAISDALLQYTPAG
jgi:hypothetical protein